MTDIYYHIGRQGSNFEYEVQNLTEELRRRGHVPKIVPQPEAYKSIPGGSVIYTNIPDEIFFGQIKTVMEEKVIKVVQITRSTDTVYNPQWVFKEATKICAACEYEYKALVELLGKDKVELTGSPYMDYYALEKEWTKEDVDPYLVVKKDYILGLQVSHEAHGFNNIDYGEIFLKDYYITEAKKLPYPVFFKVHQNHLDEHWPHGLGEHWIEAPCQKTPPLLYYSNGIYSEHFSNMLLEAAMIKKKIYIHEPSEAWSAMSNTYKAPGWWSDFEWWKLDSDTFRDNVSSWFPPYGTNSKRVADVIEKLL